MNAYAAALLEPLLLKGTSQLLTVTLHKIIRNVMYANAEEEKVSTNYYTNKC